MVSRAFAVASCLSFAALLSAGPSAALELPLPPGICAELHLAWRDDNDNPALEAARDAVRQAAGDIAQGPPPL